MRKIRRYWNSVTRTPFRKHNLTDTADPNIFQGKTILAVRELGGEPEEVTIQDVKGCAAMGLNEESRNVLVKYFQINGTHLCHMLSFYIQVLENRLPTQEESAEFELTTQITKIREIKDGASKKS